MVLRRVEDVVHREVAGETFLVPVRGHLADLGELFVLNEVGCWIWTRLEDACTFEELVRDLTAEFDVDMDQARIDAGLFVQQLVDAGLVEERAPAVG